MEALMAPISVQQLSTTIIPPRLGLLATLWQSLTLQEKLASPDKQTWYFRKGLASNQRRLRELIKTYDQHRQEFNRLNVSDMLDHKATIEHELEHVIPNQRPYIVRAMFEAGAKQHLKEIHEALTLKSRTDTLQSVEYYKTNPDALLELMGDWEAIDGEG